MDIPYHREERNQKRHRQGPRRTPGTLFWALGLVFVAAVAILVIGLLRPADAALLANYLPPPLPFAGPDLAPAGASAPAPESQPAPPGPVAPPTATVAPSATPQPSATPSPQPLPTLTPTILPLAPPTVALQVETPGPALQPVQAAVQLSGLRHMWQTWNNCGPATLAMNLSYYGSPLDQAEIGAVLRPYADDKNVTPEELAAYARSQGYAAQVRVNGSADLARRLLSNGIPLLIETWLEEQPNDGMGHYRLLTGYDDAAAHWVAYDSYVSTNLVSADPAVYQGITMPYAQTDAWWQVFHRTYVLIYTVEQEPVVRAILGDAFDPGVMWQQALATAQSEIAQNPADPFAQFNL
ncbi:MAG: C39 family peptidase, partial [Caldilineaceae bacterium]|nr:C39 family peptidase [Caldilineaceae bacterium]